MHYDEYLLDTGSCFCCGNERKKVRDCAVIDSRVRECKQVSPNVPKDDAPRNGRLYVLRCRGEKPNESDYDDGKFSFSCCNMSSF